MKKRKAAKPKKPLNLKRYLKLFYFLIAIVLLVCIFYFDRISYHLPARYKFFFEKINDTIFGKVQVVEIKGNNLVSKDEIMLAVYKDEVTPDDRVIINSEAKIRQILMKNSVIKNVNVKRFLPNKMVIYIKEKTPILKFYDENQKRFITLEASGEVLDFYNPSLNSPLVVGKFEAEDLLKFYAKVQKYEAVTRNISDIYSFFGFKFNIVLNRKTLVLLPEASLNEALEMLEVLIQENGILNKNIKQIDLRVKGKIFIKYFAKGESPVFRANTEIITFKANF